MNNSTLCKASPFNSAIAELYTQTTTKGWIPLSAWSDLMTNLLKDSINEDDKDLIKRLLYAVRRGRLKVIDEL
jgi:hypothetical protein